MAFAAKRGGAPAAFSIKRRGAGTTSTTTTTIGRSGAPAAAFMARGSPPTIAIAWGWLLCIAWGCLLFPTGCRVRGRSGAPAAASMARGSPPEFASRGSAAAAVASRGSAAAAVAWGHKGSCFAWGRQGSCFAWNRYSFCRTAGSTGADASEKGAVGYKEGRGGQETSSPSRTFAAGYTMVGAPQRGAAGHEEGGEYRWPASFQLQTKMRFPFNLKTTTNDVMYGICLPVGSIWNINLMLFQLIVLA
ncbi:UNVERIFIED_CONTAM: hypothetical protein FKN15_050556 [Acipenser sinensis]